MLNNFRKQYSDHQSLWCLPDVTRGDAARHLCPKFFHLPTLLWYLAWLCWVLLWGPSVNFTGRKRNIKATLAWIVHSNERSSVLGIKHWGSNPNFIAYIDVIKERLFIFQSLRFIIIRWPSSSVPGGVWRLNQMYMARRKCSTNVLFPFREQSLWGVSWTYTLFCEQRGQEEIRKLVVQGIYLCQWNIT